MVAVPEIEKIQFLVAPVSSSSLKLLSDLKLATCLRTLEVVEKYILPNWNAFEGGNCSYSCKEQVARLALSQYSCLSSSCRIKLRKLPVIPVARVGGRTSRFSLAEDLINPSTPGLKDLFFDDENVIPESSFLTQFHSTLNDCGLKTVVNENLVSSRARKIASSNHPFSEIEPRVHALLRSSCWWRSAKTVSDTLEFRRLKWIPALDLKGNLQLKSPTECRSLRDQLLVSSQLPIFTVSVSPDWEERLGWCDVLPKNVLLGQLKHGLQAVDRAVIDAVLTYIVEKDQTASVIGDLQSLPWILTSKGLYATASKVFHPSPLAVRCEGLHPYLGNVDEKFWHDHQALLGRMKIKEEPSLSDLFAVQAVLESRLPLNDSDTTVAIETLRLASKFQSTSLAGLKVFSKDGKFYPLHEVSYDDLGPLKTKEEVKLTHPDLSSRYVKKLGIESLRERLMKDMLNIADIDDEDEFEQHEKVRTIFCFYARLFQYSRDFRTLLLCCLKCSKFEILVFPRIPGFS